MEIVFDQIQEDRDKYIVYVKLLHDGKVLANASVPYGGDPGEMKETVIDRFKDRATEALKREAAKTQAENMVKQALLEINTATAFNNSGKEKED